MKILFVAPHSAIWVHAFPEALVAEALAQQGDEIVYVGCDGLLSSHCVSMSAVRVGFGASQAEKDRVCKVCRGNKDLLRKRFGFHGEDLKPQSTPEDQADADRILATITPQNCTELVVDGVEIGKIAVYELLLQTKKLALSFSEEEWRRYQSSIRNCLLVLRIMQRMIERIKPDRVVVYNALYSVNRTVCRLAETRGIPQYYLHAGPNLSNRLQTLTLAKGHTWTYLKHLRERWVDFKDVPCSAQDMRLATDHYLEVVRGRSMWAYSSAPDPGADLRSKFGIHDGTKVVLATLSSEDEISSGEFVGALHRSGTSAFTNQVAWIKSLLTWFRDKSDHLLILRVHPREFPNKREGTLSAHAQKLQELFSELPSNVRINWPSDNISLYDLANISDVVTNAWSSAGKEMAWLGMPVVLAFPEVTEYPLDLNYAAFSEGEYFQNLAKALAEGWSSDRIRQTYRWCAIEYGTAILDLTDSYSRPELRSFLSRATRKLIRTLAPYHEQNADCSRRAPRLGSAPRIHRIMKEQLASPLDALPERTLLTSSEETRLLRSEVRRLLEGIYGTAKVHPPQSLAGRLQSFCNG